ncbi:MAG: hypothetical protein A3K10_09320 [Bacteroidetes bacterium RIFCSPLOWO2_12_FULL_31_6]|nr:MAG: hypothetical protein A3K10_09320 [Bacteroidetes bacterium RIFCSPLOWO2_12_FULL_31_6]
MDNQKSDRQFLTSWTATQLIDSRQFRQNRLAITSQNAKELHIFSIFESWSAAHLHFAPTHTDRQ